MSSLCSYLSKKHIAKEFLHITKCHLLQKAFKLLYWEFAPEETMQELHSGCSKHALFIYLKYKTHFSLYCFYLCLQGIPCYSSSYHHVKI